MSSEIEAWQNRQERKKGEEENEHPVIPGGFEPLINKQNDNAEDGSDPEKKKAV